VTLSSTSRTLLPRVGMHHKQAGQPRPVQRTVVAMMRLITFAIAAVVLLIVLWWLTWSVVHFLMLGFWIVLLVLLGIGMFRVGRWSRRRAR